MLNWTPEACCTWPSLYSFGGARHVPPAAAALATSTSSAVEDVPSKASAATVLRTSPPSASRRANSALRGERVAVQRTALRRNAPRALIIKCLQLHRRVLHTGLLEEV